MPTDSEKIKFSETILNLSSELNLGLIETISYYCEKYEMEEIVAATLLTNSIKSKIMVEASDLNLLKEKVSRLEI
jgi:hypothetical protein